MKKECRLRWMERERERERRRDVQGNLVKGGWLVYVYGPLRVCAVAVLRGQALRWRRLRTGPRERAMTEIEIEEIPLRDVGYEVKV